MADSYITRTGTFLPGDPIPNDDISRFMGEVEGETHVRKMILRANGIKSRHYALDAEQNPTHSIVQLAAEAVKDCLPAESSGMHIDYLSAGTTYAAMLAPGLSSLLHDQLSKDEVVGYPLEINSNAGICSSGAQALVNASRAVKSGDAEKAIAVGVEQSSDGLKSSAINLINDVPEDVEDITQTQWFMSVFLRFMLSDGAGAFLVESEPDPDRVSLRIDWSYSRSFANQAPLCMHLESKPIRLSQDIRVLARYMSPLSRKALVGAFEKHDEKLENFSIVLPHMSSYYFEPAVKKVLTKLSPDKEIPYWSNLRTAGNTGAASIFIMLDEYLKSHEVHSGERILLFVPESGQFNYVLMGLTVV